MQRAVQTFFVLFLISGSASLVAQDKGSKHALWKWGSDSSTSSKDSSMFKGPQLNMPKIQAFETAKASTGRAFNSAKKRSSRMWSSTVDFLNPWDGKSSRSGTKPKSGAWFFQKKEEPQYSTVSDFLTQERPKF